MNVKYSVDTTFPSIMLLVPKENFQVFGAFGISQETQSRQDVVLLLEGVLLWGNHMMSCATAP